MPRRTAHDLMLPDSALSAGASYMRALIIAWNICRLSHAVTIFLLGDRAFESSFIARLSLVSTALHQLFIRLRHQHQLALGRPALDGGVGSSDVIECKAGGRRKQIGRASC